MCRNWTGELRIPVFGYSTAATRPGTIQVRFAQGGQPMKTRSMRKEARSETASASEELSHVICWTRMQAEAGQGIEAIVSRKELERQAGGGLFCWGIGNAPPRSLSALVRAGWRIP